MEEKLNGLKPIGEVAKRLKSLILFIIIVIFYFYLIRLFVYLFFSFIWVSKPEL